MIEFLQQSTLSPVLLCAAVIAFTEVGRVWKWRIPWKGFSFFLIVALLVAAGAYLILPVLAEDTETDIAAVAALAMRGLPVYPAPDAAARYMLLYGPLTYLAHIPFYALFGASLFSFKLIGFLAFVATIVALYQICRLFAGPGPSLIGCGCACLVLLRYVPIPFWGRIDSLLIAVIVVSYGIALRATRWTAVISTALATAILPNLKFTAVLYLLPLLAIVWVKKGRVCALAAAVLGTLLFPLPFLLPVVSFTNYLYVLGVVRHHSLDMKILGRSLQYLPLFLAPVLLAYSSLPARENPVRRQQTFYLLLISACMLLSCVVGAKAGSGSYHLLPYSAPVLHLYFWLRSSSPSVEPDGRFTRYAGAWVIVLLILSVFQLRTLLRCFQYAPEGRQDAAEISSAEIKYQGRTLEVGVGSSFTDPRTLFAALPVLHGQPHTINSSSIRDLQFGGATMPQATLDYFRQCKTQVWLIPSGQKPFTALNTFYWLPHPAFSAEFRSIFQDSYRRTASGSAYDIWTCKQ